MKNMLTLESFAEWAEKQPAEKTYNYGSVQDCAFCQYLKFLGFENVRVDPFRWRHSGDTAPFVSHPLPAGIDDAVMAGVESTDTAGLWTFGALAARLRQAVMP